MYARGYAGPTPTPTIPPPYPAPNLLLPSDGAAFTLADDVVTLQWASIGTLRPNEEYQVTIEDVTVDQGRRIVDYVTDTKYIVPTSFRPNDNIAHVMRWWVVPVRDVEPIARDNRFGIQPVHKAMNESYLESARQCPERLRHKVFCETSEV